MIRPRYIPDLVPSPEIAKRFRPLPEGEVERARQLRVRSTDAERKLWYHLRNRQFMGLKFRRQVPMNGYVLDFYCADLKLAVEADGGQHLDSQHDQQRTSALTRQGITVIRYWNHDVLNRIESVLEDLSNRIKASPLPAGEGQGEGEAWSPRRTRAGGEGETQA